MPCPAASHSAAAACLAAHQELAPADSAHKAELDADVDSLLDEIDSVLESNAEEFVRSFVQKGGQ